MNFIFEKDPDPGMRFESLLRAIFDNCERFGDPWGYSSQDVFNNFIPEPNLRGKRALSVALCKLIYDNKEQSQIDTLKRLEDSIWTSQKQEEIIEIIDNSIIWIKENLK